MPNPIYTIGLSGGIATGKSTCVNILTSILPACTVFDADACVRKLYTRKDVRAELIDYFGTEIVSSNGEINKAVIRERAFNDLAIKKMLEGVFHPKVRQECLALLEEADKRNASRLFVADIPLLFETGFDFGQSTNVLVATRRQTQIERLKNRNAWSDKEVHAAISAQMPLQKKMLIADTIFWNEGSVTMLEKQCERYLRSLELIY
ncbi:MAG: dephospho-CoA kinase [Akkermansiaceae bacterium]